MIKDQNNERYTLNLVLSDEEKIDIEFGQKDDIDKVCSELKEKYKFSYGVKDRLKEHIENFLTNQVSQRKADEIRKKLLNQKIVNKLYYQSVEDMKKKEHCISILKEKELMKEIGEQWFTPKILFYPNDTERQHYKIEDKLLKAGQISKEKKLMKKIEEDLRIKENIAKERRKNLDLMSKSSRDYQKKVRSESMKNLLQNDHPELPNTDNNNNYVEEVVTTKQDVTNNNKTFSMMNSNEDSI
jgi:hypothetical protein